MNLTRNAAQPTTVVTHRSAIAAADSGTPTAASFAQNPGDYRTARCWIAVAFTGGTTPKIDATPWLKPHGASTPIGQGEAVEYDGADGLPAGTYVVDIDVGGSDLFLYLDNVSGTPSAFTVTVSLQWL